MNGTNITTAGVDIPKIVETQYLSTPINNFTPAIPQIDLTKYTTGLAQAQGYTASALQQAEADAKMQAQMQQNEVNMANTDLSKLQSAVGGKGADRLTQYNQTDATGNSVNNLAGKLRTLNAQSQNLATQGLMIPEQIQQNVAGTGATDRGIAPIQTAQLRNNFLQQAIIAQQTAITKADYDTAKSYADQIVDAKYDQFLADIEAKKTNIANLRDSLSAAQKKEADATTRRLEKEKADYEAQIQNDKDLSNILINAAQYNAPQELLARAKQAKTSTEAAMILGQYSGDYYKTELLKQQIATEKAQRAKIFNDMAIKAAENKTLPQKQLQKVQNTYSKAVNLSETASSVLKKLQNKSFFNLTDNAITRTLTGFIPGTDSKDVNAKIDTLKAALGFDELQKMRDESPTGGALGQVTERELNFLQSAMYNLDPAQGTDQLVNQVSKVRDSFDYLGYVQENYLAGNQVVEPKEVYIQRLNEKRAQTAYDALTGKTQVTQEDYFNNLP